MLLVKQQHPNVILGLCLQMQKINYTRVVKQPMVIGVTGMGLIGQKNCIREWLKNE